MRILLVEDDLKVGALVQQGLEAEGFEIRRAYDGEEALTNAMSFDPDIVLLDLMLPKKNGFEVAQELRARGWRTPILLLTARDAPEDRDRGMAAGADDLLGKPFRFDELLRRIHALLRGYPDEDST